MGSVRGKKGDHAPDEVDFTQWIVIKDLTHKTLYFRSYADLTLQKIDMTKLKLEPGTPQHRIPLVNPDKLHIVDATERFISVK